jgi:hypothetical protein
VFWKAVHTQDAIGAVSVPSFHLNIISHVITLFNYVINSGLNNQRYTQMKSKQEQSRKQNNLITLIKYYLKLSFQEKQVKELNMRNGYIDTHNICIFTLIQLI